MSFEICSWRRTGKVIWTDRFRNKVLVSRKKRVTYKQYNEGGLTRLILVMNCFLRYVMEGKIELLGRRGRRHRQLLYILKETDGAVN